MYMHECDSIGCYRWFYQFRNKVHMRGFGVAFRIAGGDFLGYGLEGF